MSNHKDNNNESESEIKARWDQDRGHVPSREEDKFLYYQKVVREGKLLQKIASDLDEFRKELRPLRDEQ
jgi:hypothetical protein